MGELGGFCGSGSRRDMNRLRKLTIKITRDEDMHVAICKEIDVASQGVTVSEALRNLAEAFSLLEDGR